MKMPNFGTKNSLFRYFWARIFKELLPYLKLAPQICLIGKFYKEKTKRLNLRPKMPYLGTSELEFSKNYCHI